MITAFSAKALDFMKSMGVTPEEVAEYANAQTDARSGAAYSTFSAKDTAFMKSMGVTPEEVRTNMKVFTDSDIAILKQYGLRPEDVKGHAG